MITSPPQARLCQRQVLLYYRKKSTCFCATCLQRSRSPLFSPTSRQFLLFYLYFYFLLAFKLLLGMGLLTFARFRYLSMKERERSASYRVEGGKRIGGWGVVEVDDDKRRGIYEGDTAGLEDLKARIERAKSKSDEVAPDNFDKISRYEMGARSKRIW